MVYSPDAEPMGPYWAEEWGPREHCYSVELTPKDGAFRNFTQTIWNNMFHVLGHLGYLFRDAGHDIKHAVISLNKPITEEHKKRLDSCLKITPTDGGELGFC